MSYAFAVLSERVTGRSPAAKPSFTDARCAGAQKFCVCITWTKPGTADVGNLTPKLQAFIPPGTECRGFAYATSRRLAKAIRKAAEQTDTRFHAILLKAPMGSALPHYRADEEGPQQLCEALFLKELPWKLDWPLEDTLSELLQEVGHIPGVTSPDGGPLTLLLTLEGATLYTFTTSSYSARWSGHAAVLGGGSPEVVSPEAVTVNEDHVSYAFAVLHAKLTHQPALARPSFQDARCPDGAFYRVCVTWTKSRTADARLSKYKLLPHIPADRKCRGFTFARSANLADAIRTAAMMRDPRCEPVTREELPLLSCAVDLMQDFKPLPGPKKWQPGLHGLLLEAPIGPSHPRYKSNQQGSQQTSQALLLKELPWVFDWSFEATASKLLEELGHSRGLSKSGMGPMFFICSALPTATLWYFRTSCYSAEGHDLLRA